MIRKIVITLAATIAFAAGAAAQNLTVTGSVTDQEGYPLEGATVLVKGTTRGVTSDSDGRYEIVVPGNAVLEASFLGYVSQDKPVMGEHTVNFILQEDTEYLDDVIVVAYGSMSKSDFTGSASQVSGEAIANASRESIDKGMIGKVSGVRIASDNGDPGSAGNVQIRGVGSISADTAPLYVIDGVVMSSSTASDLQLGYKSMGILNTINPEDIESMTVLKDAAAASLYGSRAANGVIIITTRKGKQGKTSVSYNGEVGVSNKANRRALRMLDGPQFLQYLKDAGDNAYAINPAYSYGYTGDEIASMAADPSGKTSTDWTDQVFTNAILTNHQLSLTAGNEKTKVYAGLGYDKTDGIVVGSYFERYSGRVNVDHKVAPWLKVGVRQMISFTGTKGHSDQSTQEQGMGYATPIGVLTQSDPTAKPKNPDGSWNEYVSWSGQTGNPYLVFDSDTQYNKTHTMRSLSSLDLVVDFTDFLSLTNTFGYDYIDNKQYLWWAPSSIDGAALNGLSATYIFQTADLTNSSVLKFNDSFGGNNISALAGFEVADHRVSYTYSGANNYPNDKLNALSVGQMYGVGGASYRGFMASVLASVNYDYENRYYGSASYRRDGSSRLGPDSRWADFWSVSAAWRLSKEPFMAGVSRLFHDFKIKASYGTNGNLPAEYYAYKGLYSASGGYGTGSGIFWSNPENNALGWEKSRNFNVGFDWNLYQRIEIALEYYNKYTSSLIFNMPASAVTGFSSYTSNVGNLTNDGIEFELSSLNIGLMNFTWNTDFNFTWQRSTVESLPNGGSDIIYGDGGMYIHREGEPIYSFYLPVWKGVNPDNGLGEFWVDPEDHSKGVTNYYTEAGSTIVGKALPDFIGGITNTMTFMDNMFDLSFLISYQFGGSLFDYPGYFTHSDGFRAASMNAADDAADYWTPQNTDARFPKPIMNNPYRWDRFSSRLIKSTDNIRMREITVGFNAPVKKVVSGLRLYFRANNPFMIWSATPDIDPDVAINGYRTADVPVTRSFVFGVNITL